MIAHVTRGRGFAGLARYLESAKAGQGVDRVAWCECRNLPTEEPALAARFMRATAAQSVRIDKPVYHLSLSWDPSDPVDRTQVVAVADRVLRELGLEEHQVLLVAHRDTPHPHVHLMINRVHPETGRAWKGWRDFHALQRSLQAIEREMGFREVPGHRIRRGDQEPPDRSRALSTGELRAWERTGEKPFVELVREVAGRHFAEATSWADLDARLGRHGLRLEARGRGLVVTDGWETCKSSAVGREAGRGHLERRLGERDVEFPQGREPARAAADRSGGRNPSGRGERGPDHGCGDRGEDSARPGAGGIRPGASGRADGADLTAAGVAASWHRGAGAGRRSDGGRHGRVDAAVDTVRRQVEQMELGVRDPGARGKTAGADSLRHSLQRALLALAPEQIRTLESLLTRPQRLLVEPVIRTVRAMLLERDRERE